MVKKRILMVFCCSMLWVSYSQGNAVQSLSGPLYAAQILTKNVPAAVAAVRKKGSEIWKNTRIKTNTMWTLAGAKTNTLWASAHDWGLWKVFLVVPAVKHAAHWIAFKVSPKRYAANASAAMNPQWGVPIKTLFEERADYFKKRQVRNAFKVYQSVTDNKIDYLMNLLPPAGQSSAKVAFGEFEWRKSWLVDMMTRLGWDKSEARAKLARAHLYQKMPLSQRSANILTDSKPGTQTVIYSAQKESAFQQQKDNGFSSKQQQQKVESKGDRANIAAGFAMLGAGYYLGTKNEKKSKPSASDVAKDEKKKTRSLEDSFEVVQKQSADISAKGIKAQSPSPEVLVETAKKNVRALGGDIINFV